MIKKAIYKGLSSFSYGVTINLILGILLTFTIGEGKTAPVVPEFAAHFPSDLIAFGVQCLLIGITAMSFSMGTEIMEIKSWSLVKQSIVYFIVTSAVWVPVSMFCWGFGKYMHSTITVICSYVTGYVISWYIQYRICRQDIEAINRKLEELNQS